MKGLPGVGKIWVIFIQELRILFRDKQALGLLFLMPLALIIFLTLALQDVYLAKVGSSVSLKIVTHQECRDPHEICAQFIAEMSRLQNKVSVMREEDENSKAQITLLLPPQIEATLEALKNGKTLKENEQIQLIFDPVLDHSLRSLVHSHLLAALQGVLIEQVHNELKKMEKSGGAPVLPTDILPNLSHFEGLVKEQAMGGMVLPNPIQQSVPAWALFGMFFIVIPISSSMIRDRNLGIFKRLLSFPVSRADLLIGKILPFLTINFLQFGLMFAVGVFILPHLTHLNLNLEFSLWGLAAVTLISSLAATSYGLMVSCLSKTQEQASAFGALSVVILAVLGGVMIPRLVMPDFMQSLSQISPLYWGMEAYYDVILRKTEILVWIKKLGVLSLFSAVCGGVSLLHFRWNDV